jgi:hypothetical protein
VVVFGGLTRTLFPASSRMSAELAAARPRRATRCGWNCRARRDSSLLGAAELAFAPLLGDPLGSRTALPDRPDPSRSVYR